MQAKQIKIGINGFGRIGRLAARIILSKYTNIEIVAVNDLTSPENLAYLLGHDSTYHNFDYSVIAKKDNLIVTRLKQEYKIKVFSEKDPQNIPWGELGVDIVLECTGHFLTHALASLHLQAGAKHVILSAPAKDLEIPTIVIGVNHDLLSKLKKSHDNLIISNASCTTNCIAPAFKVLSQNYNLKYAHGLTVHAYTATQVLQDGPSHKDFRDGRAAAQNMIPSKTGAAKALELVIPELKGKLNLSSLRVPIITGSMVYITARIESLLGPGLVISPQDVNACFKSAAKTSMRGIISHSNDDLVSSDIIGDSHSCVVDAKLTEVTGNAVKLVLWYDNEWGYANRLVELVKLLG